MPSLTFLTVAFIAMAALAIWSVRRHLKNYDGPSPTDGAETPLPPSKLGGIGGMPAAGGEGEPTKRRTLREGFAALVRPLSEPGILIRQSLQPSTAHFGGLPPAYSAFTWPHHAGSPLTLLAKIDLDKLPPVIDWLPRAGTLLFFYDLERKPAGAEPRDREGWAVLFFPASQGVPDGRREPSHGAPAPLNEVAIAAEPIPTLPPLESKEMRALDLSGDEQEEIAEYFGGKHQMGGHAKPTRDSFMEFECQLGLEGISRLDLTGPDDPRTGQLMAGTADWRLLLQVASDERVSVNFGNPGALFFWVRETDARRGDFSKVWCVLQGS